MTKTTVNIHGKEYETVASRVYRFRKQYENKLSIETKIIERDETTVVMKATIRDLVNAGNVIATGHAEENRQASTINKTSALENCETSAIGRALAAFGLAGTEYASADEVARAISQQGASTQLSGEATDKQKQMVNRLLDQQGIPIETQAEFLISEFGVKIPLSKQVASEVIDQLMAKDTE